MEYSFADLISNPANKPVMGSEAERLGYFAGQFAVIFAILLSLVAAPIIIYGAVKMSNGSSYGWAKTASILAIIPFTSFCFLIGAPIGIWALVVLSKPEVKLFYGRSGANNQPPPPPQYYSST
jgi:ABC-type proline/glycine betaine transport system permease subunit